MRSLTPSVTSRASCAPRFRPSRFRRWLRTALLAVIVVGSPGQAANEGSLAAVDDATDRTVGYSPLAEIDRGSVARLRLAWSQEIASAGTFRGGVAADGGRLYVATSGVAMAIEGATGERVWTVDVSTQDEEASVSADDVARSPLVWGDLLLLAQAGEVVAVHRDDGSPAWRTDVRSGPFAERIGAHPTYTGEAVVVGTTPVHPAPVSGRLVGLDPRDGSIRWSMRTVPDDPSDPAFGSWSPLEPTWSHGIGGGGVVNAGAYDPTTGVVVFATGAPFPEDRSDERRANSGTASADLRTSAFVAVDAATGEPRWTHQVVPGDEWSYGQIARPIVGVHADDPTRSVVHVATTTGWMLTLDAADGAVLRHDRLAPESTVHVGYDEDGRPLIAEEMRGLHERTAVRTCPKGGWVGLAPAAVHPELGLTYRPNETACSQFGIRSPVEGEDAGPDPIWLSSAPRRAGDHYERWGALTAIDPRTGEVRWEFATPYPHDSGVLATGGGLVFSAFADRTFRAFDAATGEVLWRQVLTAHSDATPATYLAEGRQYVVIAVGHRTGRSAMPSAGLPSSVPGSIALFAFTLEPAR